MSGILGTVVTSHTVGQNYLMIDFALTSVRQYQERLLADDTQFSIFAGIDVYTAKIEYLNHLSTRIGYPWKIYGHLCPRRIA